MTRSDLERLASVRLADVYKAGRLAASLDRRDGPTRFTYVTAYLRAGGGPVSTTLPLGEEPVLTQGGAVPPYFAGLLPEGRRLTSLRRAVKTSADDELSLLLAVGSDLIGDVQVVPQGDQPTRAPCVVEVEREREFSSVLFADLLETAGVVDPVGLPGVQDKVSARMISPPIRRAGERYLLKLDPPEFPHVVANEAYFLSRARGAKLPTASARVVVDAEGRCGLLVRRFDRVPQPSGESLALACEDACQVLGRWPADKYSVDTEDVVRALADHCAARAVAIRDLYRQFCFAWLTGNGDVHAKNLSILQQPGGEWRIAPAYDLPATVPYGDTTLALSIQGRTSGLSRRILLLFADAIGVPNRLATRVLDDLLGRLADLPACLLGGVLPFAQKPTADWVAELRHRHRLARAP